MKRFILIFSSAIFLSGCVNQPPPPPRPDPIVGMSNAVTAFAAMAQASKQAKAIRNDTAVLFPVRSQAIALSILSFRVSNSRWPVSKVELREYLVTVCQSNHSVAPSESDFNDFALGAAIGDDIKFSFTREGLADENYTMNSTGVISFSISPQKVASQQSAPVSSVSSSKYPWGDLAVTLFVEIPLKVMAAKK